MSKKVVKTIEHCECEHSREWLEHETSLINEYLYSDNLTEAESRLLRYFDSVFGSDYEMQEDSREYKVAFNLAWELKYRLANSRRQEFTMSDTSLQFYYALNDSDYFSKNGIDSFWLYAKIVFILLKNLSGICEKEPMSVEKPTHVRVHVSEGTYSQFYVGDFKHYEQETDDYWQFPESLPWQPYHIRVCKNTLEVSSSKTSDGTYKKLENRWAALVSNGVLLTDGRFGKSKQGCEAAEQPQ